MTPTRKPPHSVQVLQRWITQAERHSGVAVVRQQRWVSYMILAAMLDRARDADDRPLFLLKGGVALELRLGLQARATKDYDVAFRAEMNSLLNHLDQVLRDGHGWPPNVTVFNHWPEPYRVLAEQIGFPVLDVRDAADRVQRMVAEINRSGVSVNLS